MSVVSDRRADYQQSLRDLSEASVERHFDAFNDVPWNDPSLAVVPDDPRWVLPQTDLLGATTWYRSLPVARQIYIGLYRQAQQVKVGLQFEQLLISGLMNYALVLPNGSAEFRYCMHEATEECHHVQMFQELIEQIGIDVDGAPWWLKTFGPRLATLARKVPFGFFIGVLAGEEPIDYMQKQILRGGDCRHPLVTRVMQIHVAEEARHIGFAHHYLRYRAPRLGRSSRALVSLLLPAVMRVLCDAIMTPNPKMLHDLKIPKEVAREAWWDSDLSRKHLRDTFGDVRMLAVELELMNPLSRRLWRSLKIDGQPSRFRSEPKSASN